jgi:hypothetical protein
MEFKLGAVSVVAGTRDRYMWQFHVDETGHTRQALHNLCHSVAASKHAESRAFHPATVNGRYLCTVTNVLHMLMQRPAGLQQVPRHNGATWLYHYNCLCCDHHPVSIREPCRMCPASSWYLGAAKWLTMGSNTSSSDKCWPHSKASGAAWHTANCPPPFLSIRCTKHHRGTGNDCRPCPDTHTVRPLQPASEPR